MKTKKGGKTKRKKEQFKQKRKSFLRKMNFVFIQKTKETKQRKTRVDKSLLFLLTKRMQTRNQKPETREQRTEIPFCFKIFNK